MLQIASKQSLLRLLSFILIAGFSFVSCEETTMKGDFSFSLKKESRLQKNGGENVLPDRVVMSIKRQGGGVVYDKKEVKLYHMNGYYVTRSLSLNVGVYEVVEFLVVDSVDNILYAAPKKGSENASMVDDPLPVAFRIAADRVNNVTVQVVDIAGDTPDQFGYAMFGFEIVGSVDLEKGLMAYYPFNENARDESGHGRYATVEGCSLTNDRFGNANSAYHFDGVDDYIELYSYFDYPYRTINLWFIPDSIYPENYQPVYNADHYSLDYGSTIMSIREYNGKDSISFACGQWDKGRKAPVSEGQWHMATFIKKDHQTEYYLNGRLVDRVYRVRNNTSKRSRIPAAVLGVGRMFDHYLEGKIDDVRIYNRGLNEKEIKALYLENGW